MAEQGKRPTVSVVMSVYNGAPYLCECVDSILGQTFWDFEFIIINDGSTDETPAILAGYDDPRIRVFHQDNTGLTKALNRGLREARGVYIARMDADDVSLPDRFEKQVAFLEDHPEIGLVGTAFHVVDARGELLFTRYPPATDTAIRWELMFCNPFCHASAMMRADLVRSLGLTYDETLPFAQDYALWTRLACHTGMANLSAPCVHYRLHDTAAGAVHKAEQQRIALSIAFHYACETLPGLVLSEREAALLQRFYGGIPPEATPAELQVLRKYFELLQRFEKRPDSDPVVIRELRRGLVARGLAGLSVGRIPAFFSSGLLGFLCRQDPATACGVFVRGAVRSGKRLVRRRGDAC